jgi:opacity protein-like surface antigen
MKRRALIVSAAAILAASSLFAQVRQNTVELSPFAGYLFGGRFARGSNALFNTRVDVDDHATYGVRLGFNVTSNFELELQGSRTETSFVTPEGGQIFGPGRQRLGDLDIDYLLGYMTFNFGHRRAIPYVTLGAGIARLDPKVPAISSDRENRFTGSIGAGVKTFFTPNFGLRFDGRYYATSLSDSNDHDRNHDCGAFDNCDNRKWLNNGEVSGGLLFAF